MATLLDVSSHGSSGQSSLLGRIQTAASTARTLAADLTLHTLQGRPTLLVGDNQAMAPVATSGLFCGGTSSSSAAQGSRGDHGKQQYSSDNEGTQARRAMPRGNPGQQQNRLRHAASQHKLLGLQRENEGLHALNAVLVEKSGAAEQRAAQAAAQLKTTKHQLETLQQVKNKLSAAKSIDAALYQEMCRRATENDQRVRLLQGENNRLSAEACSMQEALDEQHHTINGMHAANTSLDVLYKEVSWLLLHHGVVLVKLLSNPSFPSLPV